MIGILDLLIDERDQHLDEGLHLARNARRRTARQLGHAEEGNQAEQTGDDQRIEMKGPESLTDGQVGQVVNDVSTRCERFARSHEFPLFDYCCRSSAIQ